MRIQYIFIITYLVTICAVAESAHCVAVKSTQSSPSTVLPVPAVIAYYQTPVTNVLEIFFPSDISRIILGYHNSFDEIPGNLIPVKYEENGQLKETRIIVPEAIWRGNTLEATSAQLYAALKRTKITLPEGHFWDCAFGGEVTEETGTFHETLPLINRTYVPNNLSSTTPSWYIALATWHTLPQRSFWSKFRSTSEPEAAISKIQHRQRTYFSHTVIVACKEQEAWQRIRSQGNTPPAWVRRYVPAIPREQTK